MSKHKVTVLVDDGKAIFQTDRQTGDTEEITPVLKESPKGFSNPLRNSQFIKVYNKAWSHMKTQLTKRELAIVDDLREMATIRTNSLKPLGDDTTKKRLSELFGIDRKLVDKVFNKLFDLGIIGKFQVSEWDGVVRTYWKFNPYLAFNGNNMSDSTWELFKNTTYAKLHNK